MFTGGERRFRFFGSTPRDIPSRQYSDSDKTRMIEEVLGREMDHRTQTYGIALNQLPAEKLSSTKQILEIGLNQRLFLFKDLFAHDLSIYGLTLDTDHKKAAEKEGKKTNVSTKVILRNAEEPFPDNFPKVDVALDIYSASHYADTDRILSNMAGAVKPGGYLLVVPGGSMVFADHARLHPESMREETGPVFRFDKAEGEVFLKTFGKSRGEAISNVAEMFSRWGKVKFTEADLEEQVSDEIEHMGNVLGESVVTHFDILDYGRVCSLYSMDFSNVRRFRTQDGAGFVGMKREA